MKKYSLPCMLVKKMSEGTLQLLFESFLEANSIKYKLKDNVYDVAFPKEFGNIFGEKVKCTFDEQLAEQKNLLHLGHGSFILSKIISMYLDQKGIFALAIKPKHEGINAAQDKIDEMRITHKNGSAASYKLEEHSIDLCFASMRLEMRSVLGRDNFFSTTLFHNEIDPVFDNEELLLIDFEKIKNQKMDIPHMVQEAKELFSKHFADQVQKKQQQHIEFVQKEVKLKEEHYERQLLEANMIVDQARWKIEEKRQAALKSRSFETMYSRAAEQKSAEKKMKGAEKDVFTAKEELREEMLAELEQIRNMKLSCATELLQICIIQVQAFTIQYETGKKFLYIPELQVMQEK